MIRMLGVRMPTICICKKNVGLDCLLSSLLWVSVLHFRVIGAVEVLVMIAVGVCMYQSGSVCMSILYLSVVPRAEEWGCKGSKQASTLFTYRFPNATYTPHLLVLLQLIFDMSSL